MFHNIKTKLGLTISSGLSALGAGSGTATAVCQTTCSTSSALPLLGLTLSATPLAFIADYQLPLWWLSFTVFTVLAILYAKKIFHTKTDRAFLFLNTGLLTIGFPYLRQNSLLFLLIGTGIVLFGLSALLFAKRMIGAMGITYEK